MIVVFFQLPKQLGPNSAPLSVVNGRAATSAAEVTNTIEWLILN